MDVFLFRSKTFFSLEKTMLCKALMHASYSTSRIFEIWRKDTASWSLKISKMHICIVLTINSFSPELN